MNRLEAHFVELLFPLASLLEKLEIASASTLPVPSRVAYHRAMKEMMKLEYHRVMRDLLGI